MHLLAFSGGHLTRCIVNVPALFVFGCVMVTDNKHEILDNGMTNITDTTLYTRPLSWRGRDYVLCNHPLVSLEQLGLINCVQLTLIGNVYFF